MEEGRMDGERGEKDPETLKLRLFPILYLTLSASVGGLVFGYYVGFLIARFGMLSDIDSILHEAFRTGLVGAIMGAAAAGWSNDCLGRKRSILIADVLIFIGGVMHILAVTTDYKYFMETIQNMLIAFAVGMVSMTSPLYISEFSPLKLRDIFVSMNFIFYGIGKFAFFYIYGDSIRTANYIIALAGIPSLIQFCLMFSSPEPPVWLYKKDREDDAIKALKNIYTCCDVEKEFDAFRLLIKRETIDADDIAYFGSSVVSKIRSAWNSPLVRKQFVVSTALQVVQQLVGMNALIYCASSIRRMSGFGASDPKTDISFMKETLEASHGISPIFGGFCYALCLTTFGKRKILRWSIYFMLGAALGLSFIFTISPSTTEAVSRSESTIYFSNNTCLSYITAPDADSWDCLACLRAGCGYCRGTHYNILGQSSGACLIVEPNGTSQACTNENRSWNTKHCEYSVLQQALLMTFELYGLSYSVGLEIIPWILNSHTYPTEVRGIFGGMAAAAHWTFFLVITALSFFLTEIGGPLFIFLLISLFLICLVWYIRLIVPENISCFMPSSQPENRKLLNEP